SAAMPASSVGCRTSRLLSSKEYSASTASSALREPPSQTVAATSNLYGASPCTPMAARVRPGPSPPSWCRPATTSHHGETEWPYSASSDQPVRWSSLRRPSLRSHRRSTSPPNQPLASHDWPLPWALFHASRWSNSTRLLKVDACSIEC